MIKPLNKSFVQMILVVCYGMSAVTDEYVFLHAGVVIFSIQYLHSEFNLIGGDQESDETTKSQD